MTATPPNSPNPRTETALLPVEAVDREAAPALREAWLKREARRVLSNEYSRLGKRIDAANVRVMEQRSYADWKDHAAIAAMIAFAEEARLAERDRAAGIAEAFEPTGYMSDRERSYCRQHGEDIARDIRSEAK